MMFSDGLLIHYNNSSLKPYFNKLIPFILKDSNNPNIDKYINNDLIPKIFENNFKYLVIKDSLSINYLDFYGLILAYHIRLSLDEKQKFIPIIIESDINLDLINRLTPLASILFTPNIFFLKRNINQINVLNNIINNLEYSKLNSDNFQKKFLNRIDIQAPKDYLTQHSISNEWGIYKWSKFLKLTEDVEISKINNNISSLLYFKYLKNKFELNFEEDKNLKFKINKKSKIVYIDDEWEKGWHQIFNCLFTKNENEINYKCVDIIYKDKNSEEVKKSVLDYINNESTSELPDLVILDLRLCDDDFNKNTKIEDLTGSKLLIAIKNINPGIQCILFTASENSLIIDEISKNGIIGYVKKEHPSNKFLSTKDNIIKMNMLINKAIEKKDLKYIWIKKNSIITNTPDFKLKDEIKKMVESVYNILDSEIPNSSHYSVLAIYKCLEILKDYYIREESGKLIFNDDPENYEIDLIENNGSSGEYKNEKYDISLYKELGYEVEKKYKRIYYSTENRIHAFVYQVLDLDDKNLHDKIKDIADYRNKIIHQKDFTYMFKISEISNWLDMLYEITSNIYVIKE